VSKVLSAFASRIVIDDRMRTGLAELYAGLWSPIEGAPSFGRLPGRNDRTGQDRRKTGRRPAGRAIPV